MIGSSEHINRPWWVFVVVIVCLVYMSLLSERFHRNRNAPTEVRVIGNNLKIQVFFHVGTGFSNIRLSSCTCLMPFCRFGTSPERTWYNAWISRSSSSSGRCICTLCICRSSEMARVEATQQEQSGFISSWGETKRSEASAEEVLGQAEGVFWGLLWVDLAGSSYWKTLISVSLVLLFP